MNYRAREYSPAAPEPFEDEEGVPVPSRRQFAPTEARSRQPLPKSRIELNKFRPQEPVTAGRLPAPSAEPRHDAGRSHAERAAMFRQLLAEIAAVEEDERQQGEPDGSGARYRGPFPLQASDRETLQGWNSRLVGNLPLGDEPRGPRRGYDGAEFDALLDELR